MQRDDVMKEQKTKTREKLQKTVVTEKHRAAGNFRTTTTRAPSLSGINHVISVRRGPLLPRQLLHLLQV